MLFRVLSIVKLSIDLSVKIENNKYKSCAILWTQKCTCNADIDVLYSRGKINALITILTLPQIIEWNVTGTNQLVKTTTNYPIHKLYLGGRLHIVIVTNFKIFNKEFFFFFLTDFTFGYQIGSHSDK